MRPPNKLTQNNKAEFAGITPRKPRILHLTHFDPPLHGEAMMACLLRECASEWEDIDYRFINTAYATKREALTAISLVKLAKVPWYLLRMATELMRFRPELVIVQPAFHPGPFLKDSLFIWLASAFGFRVTAWVHMDPSRLNLEKKPAWFQKWLKLTLKQIELFVACAPSLPALWPDWISSRPCVAVTNAIPDPTPGYVQSRELPDRPLHILYISAMDPEKGWRNLLEAARTICETHPTVTFEFRGDPAGGETEESIHQAFATSGFPDRIKWNGPAWDKEKAACFLHSDLFVLPSWTEQFPLAVLEAMAYRMPVIASDVGAVSDAFSMRKDAMLIPANDTEALTAAIHRFLNLDSTTRRAMGQANRCRFEKNFSSAAFGENWRKLVSDKLTSPKNKSTLNRDTNP